MNYRQVAHPISMQLCVPVEELPDDITLAARRRKPRHLVSGFSYERSGGGNWPARRREPCCLDFDVFWVLSYFWSVEMELLS